MKKINQSLSHTHTHTHSPITSNRHHLCQHLFGTISTINFHQQRDNKTTATTITINSNVKWCHYCVRPHHQKKNEIENGTLSSNNSNNNKMTNWNGTIRKKIIHFWKPPKRRSNNNISFIFKLNNKTNTPIKFLVQLLFYFI